MLGEGGSRSAGGGGIRRCGGYFCGKRECVHFVGENPRDEVTKKQLRPNALFILDAWGGGDPAVQGGGDPAV